VFVVRVRDATRVHELDDDAAATRVHGVGDLAPARDLLRAVDARGVQVALADRTGLGALGDDQTGGRALSVVRGGDGLGHAVAVGAVAGQGGHDDPVGKGVLAHGDGLEQVRHEVWSATFVEVR
jgi:hypothetical protein